MVIILTTKVLYCQIHVLLALLEPRINVLYAMAKVQLSHHQGRHLDKINGVPSVANECHQITIMELAQVAKERVNGKGGRWSD